MPKHPHMIRLIEGRTWKCMFDGCSWFVHMGLAHIMIGKSATCFECRQNFTVADNSIESAKLSGFLQCDECLENKLNEFITKREKTPQLHANNCPAWLGDSCTCGVGDS